MSKKGRSYGLLDWILSPSSLCILSSTHVIYIFIHYFFSGHCLPFTMFACPSPAETKRPRLKPSKSTGWSWPRLVTVQEAKQASAARVRADRTITEDQAPDAMNANSLSSSPIQNSDPVALVETNPPNPQIEQLGGKEITCAKIPLCVGETLSK